MGTLSNTSLEAKLRFIWNLIIVMELIFICITYLFDNEFCCEYLSGWSLKKHIICVAGLWQAAFITWKLMHGSLFWQQICDAGRDINLGTCCWGARGSLTKQDWFYWIKLGATIIQNHWSRNCNKIAINHTSQINLMFHQIFLPILFYSSCLTWDLPENNFSFHQM